MRWPLKLEWFLRVNKSLFFFMWRPRGRGRGDGVRGASLRFFFSSFHKFFKVFDMSKVCFYPTHLEVGCRCFTELTSKCVHQLSDVLVHSLNCKTRSVLIKFSEPLGSNSTRRRRIACWPHCDSRWPGDSKSKYHL